MPPRPNDGDVERRVYRIEALAKGLQILTLFSADRNSLRLKEIVELSGIPMPTAFRIVSTLEAEGFIERGEDGSLRPDIAVLKLGFAALQSFDLVQTSSAILRKLADQIGETVNLGVLVGDKVLFIARVQHPYSLVAADIQVGSMVPAVFSSIGRILLAYLPREEASKLITKESFVGGRSPTSPRTKTELFRQLASVPSDGYTIQHEEAVAGLASIAGPIWQANSGVIAALNVVVVASEYDSVRMAKDLRDPLLAACADISARLGGTHQ